MIGDRYRAAELKRRQLLDAGLRYWHDDGYDQRVASHEAGHVVVAWLLDLDPTHVRADMGEGFAGQTSLGVRSTDDNAFDHAVVLMAGAEAEALFGFEADDGARTDLKQARAMICRSSGDVTIADARRRARRLLRANRGALVAVTVALLAKRSIDQAEIAAIMGDNTDTDVDDENQLIFENEISIRHRAIHHRIDGAII
jgi:ATP-dependent Zn protease